MAGLSEMCVVSVAMVINIKSLLREEEKPDFLILRKMWDCCEWTELFFL